MAYSLKEASNWWEEINKSSSLQDRIFHVLAALYGLAAVVALVQLKFTIRPKTSPGSKAFAGGKAQSDGQMTGQHVAPYLNNSASITESVVEERRGIFSFAN